MSVMEYSKKLNSSTEVIGVIGHPIRHSFSPLMHNTAFILTGLNYVYLAFDVHSTYLKAALKSMNALGIKGFNVTVPHKEKIYQYLENVSDEASVIGAVNTIVNDGGKLFGYNTDVMGIMATLAPYKDEIADSEVSVIGAGGAARSVIYTLIQNFKVGKINLINRTVQRTETLRDFFSQKMHFESFGTYELFPPDLTKTLSGSKLIINTTSIGMNPNADDSPTTIEESFNENQIVFDVIYTPLKTKLLSIAESKGARTINGLTMFVEQGAKAFELWTGLEMPKEPVYDTLRANIM